MIEKVAIKSVIDIGCGRGFAADYFMDKGMDVRGVEGCKEAIERNLLAQKNS